MQTIKTITIERASEQDSREIYQLLEQSRLPIAGLAEHLKTALVARQDKTIIGCAALEVYGTHALLRSVAVEPTYQNTGIGQRLIQEIIELAQQKKIKTVYLLTETAPKFFERFRFQPITRADVVSNVKQSVEFTGVCPASAIVMKLDLI